jgi:predicted alpha-1,6-mannanase (GH76 family)
MEHIYNGFKITYIESSDKWRVLNNHDFEFGDFEHEKLSECKKWIDRKLAADKRKENEHFERRKAIYRHYARGLEVVTVTSFVGKEYGRDKYWVTYADKRREKVSGISEYDAELFEQWQNIRSKIISLEREKEEIESKLQPFKKD